MRKVLLLAYSVSPTRGSEYSVAWNYIVNMSKNNELIVLYGASGDHIGDVKEIQTFLSHTSIPNVTFVQVIPNNLTILFNSLNIAGVFSYSFYIAYNNWHKQAYLIALDIVKSQNVNIVHFLCPIGYREPGYLWKLNLPYVWGPIGGTNNFPIQLLPALSYVSAIKLVFRAIVNTIQLRFNKRIRLAIKNSDILLTATLNTKEKIDRVFDIDSIYIPENGISSDIIPKGHLVDYNKIKLIWIGSIDERKALITLLKAFCLINKPQCYELHIVGDGPLNVQLRKFSVDNKIDDFIVWHGKVSRDKVFDLIKKSDLHILTSLSEANTTVVFETLSMGIPTMTLDHCGMSDVITSDCGIKIPINSFTGVVGSIADILNKITMNEINLDNLSVGATARARQYTWSLRIPFFENMYNYALESFNKKK